MHLKIQNKQTPNPLPEESSTSPRRQGCGVRRQSQIPAVWERAHANHIWKHTTCGIIWRLRVSPQYNVRGSFRWWQALSQVLALKETNANTPSHFCTSCHHIFLSHARLSQLLHCPGSSLFEQLDGILEQQGNSHPDTWLLLVPAIFHHADLQGQTNS